MTSTVFRAPIAIVSLVLALAASGAAFAADGGDPAEGKKVFNTCKACHSLEEGKNKVGPSLHGIFGREAGSVEGFSRYSDANKDSHIVWTEEVMFEYLENPREYLPGTTMGFIGLKKEEDRRNVIAYLKENTQ